MLTRHKAPTERMEMYRRTQLTLQRAVAPVLASSVLLLTSCMQEPPAPTVDEFVENPRMLESAVLRCAENRLELKYTDECLNARDAVDRIAAAEEAASRQELEAQSERKRDALRRAQGAATAAQERAEELERQRREAEYLGQFESLPNEETGDQPQNPGAPQLDGGSNTDAPTAGDDGAGDEAEPPTPGSLTPAPDENDAPSTTGDESLEAVREELQRRQEADNQ